VTAGWLARRWRATAWVWRTVLVTLVAGLALINAAGVYAQLVAAHVGERGAATSAVEIQEAALRARIDVQAHTVVDLETGASAKSIPRSRRQPSAAGPQRRYLPSRGSARPLPSSLASLSVTSRTCCRCALA